MLKCSKFSRSMVNEKFVKKNWFVMNKIIWFLINIINIACYLKNIFHTSSIELLF